MLSQLPSWENTMSTYNGGDVECVYLMELMRHTDRCQLSAGDHTPPPLPTTNTPCLLGKSLVPRKGFVGLLSFSLLNVPRKYVSPFALRMRKLRATETVKHTKTVYWKAPKSVSEPTVYIFNCLRYPAAVYI